MNICQNKHVHYKKHHQREKNAKRHVVTRELRKGSLDPFKVQQEVFIKMVGSLDLHTKLKPHLKQAITQTKCCNFSAITRKSNTWQSIEHKHPIGDSLWWCLLTLQPAMQQPPTYVKLTSATQALLHITSKKHISTLLSSARHQWQEN